MNWKMIDFWSLANWSGWERQSSKLITFFKEVEYFRMRPHPVQVEGVQVEELSRIFFDLQLIDNNVESCFCGEGSAETS